MIEIKGHALGFGDLVGTLYHLENLGRQLNEKITWHVFDRRVVNLKKLCPIEHVEFKPTPGPEILHAGIVPDLPEKNILKKLYDFSKNGQCPKQPLHIRTGIVDGYQYLSILVRYLTKEYGYDPEKGESFELLKPEFPKSSRDLVLFQFDGRAENKARYVYKYRDKIKKLTDKYEYIAGIGGPTTTPYLSYPNYITGTVSFILPHMWSCKLFLGCDSGMSHIAGAFGVKSQVFIVGGCFHCLQEYYSYYHGCSVLKIQD